MIFQKEFSKLINWENMQIKTLAKKKKVRNEKKVFFKIAKYALA